MTEKIRREATEQIAGTVQKVDMAVKSAVHTRVRKEPSLPVMHRLENSRRMAVS